MPSHDTGPSDRMLGTGSSYRVARRLMPVSVSDLAYAVAVAAMGAGFAGALSASFGVGVPLATAGVVAVEAVPLVWRRRAPVVVLVLTLALGSVPALLEPAAFSPLLAAIVATYTVATQRPLPVTAAAAGLAAVGTPLVLHGLFDGESPYHVTVLAGDYLVNYIVGSLVAFGCAAGLGIVVRAWRERTARLEDYAARLERERSERARRAVLEERARIARELHDVAAHHLSGLVLLSGALERQAAGESPEVRQLAADVREGGATALASMRRLVGLLRAADDDPADRGSQPSLADLDGLVDAARRDGLEVDFDTDGVTGETDDVPDEVGLAAYRIVQESLSNTRRHAAGARARVQLARRNGRLLVEVADDGGRGAHWSHHSGGAGSPSGQRDPGRGAPHDHPSHGAPQHEPGHGLIGMRERVTLLGGKFDAGPRDPSGWRVRAELPTTDAELPTTDADQEPI